MKLLLDENLPHDFRHKIVGHEVFTVQYMGWSGVKNGELLSLAAAAGFMALITMDSGVPYQQNTTSLPTAVVVLKALSNDLDDLHPLVPRLLEQLEQLKPHTVVWVA
jgi:hypothetical protein